MPKTIVSNRVDPLLRYGVATLAVAVAVLLRASASRWMGDALPLTMLYGAVAFTVWFAGTGAAIWATLVGYLAADYFFIAPIGTLGVHGSAEVIAVMLYLTSCGIIIGFGRAARVAQERSRRQLEQLRERSEETRRLLDVMPAAVWIAHDPECREITGNRMANELVGVGQGTNVSQSSVGSGAPHIRQLDPEGREYSSDQLPLQAAAATGLPVRGAELDLTGPSGQRVILMGNALPLFGPDGSVRGAVAAFTDITGLRRAERAVAESEREFRALFALSGVGQMQVDPLERRLVRVNQRLCEITGYSERELLAKRISDLVHPADRAEDDLAWRRLLAGELDEFNQEKRYVRNDGAVIWVHTTATMERDRDGWPVRVTGVIQDVTERHRSEEELRDMAARLTEADRRKDEFLAVLSHELRNPLAPVRNALHIVRLRVTPDAELQWAVGVIDRQVQHLTRLVDDLLDVARITGGRLQIDPHPVDLGRVLQGAAETSRPLMDGAGHSFRLTVPPSPLVVNADPMRLRQVFSNLLNNAARYTERGGRIEAEARREGREAVVLVRDSGIGIAPEVLPRIFDLFVQGDRTTERASGGLGIGLSLAKRLVEMHGGRIEAHSEGQGRGSEFTVSLPLLGPEAGDGDPSSPGLPRLFVRGAGRVLVVDDNPDSAESLAGVLGLLGYEARVAVDGESALETAAAFRPEVAFLDLGMPGMDGYELARRLRERPEGRGTVLVALTGWGQPEDRKRSQEAGFALHLTKPLDPVMLGPLLARLRAEAAAG